MALKFSCMVTINKPRSFVVDLFKDPAMKKEYQDGFLREELISGNPGEVGCVTAHFYKQGRHEMELIETIQDNSLPEEFTGYYQHISMDNTMRSIFQEIDANTTQYIAEIEYVEMRGLIPKLMVLLVPNLFQRQVQKWLANFKELAERQ